ncbi:MAG: transglutaminase-like domain-containing protein [Thermoanaerobaculaceae bacterium]
MRPVAVLLALAGGWLPRPAAADEAHFWFPTELAAQVETGVRGGLVVGIERDGAGALVTVSGEIRPLGQAPAVAPVRPEATGDRTTLTLPRGFVPPPELADIRTSGLDAWETTLRVVEFVSARVALDEADSGAQDASSVLARGRARCSGRANAAVGLLRAVGVPARVVHGVVVGERAARWHRWGEAWLGRLGWVPFDPGIAVGALSVRYVPMRGAGEGASLGGIRLLGIDERGYAALPIRNRLRLVPVQGVTVRVASAQPARQFWAALYGPDGSRRILRGTGEVVFSGLLAGRYRVVWADGQELRQAEVVLGGEELVRLDLGRLEGS